MRLLHAGHADGGGGPAERQHPTPTARRSASTCPATSAVAPATRRSSTRSRWSRRSPLGGRAGDERHPDPDSIGLSRDRTCRTPTSAARCRGPNLPKLVQGRGRYTDDIVLPRMLHVAFYAQPARPCAHRAIDSAAAHARAGRACASSPAPTSPSSAARGSARAGASDGHEVGAAARARRSTAPPGRASRWSPWSPTAAPRPRMRAARSRSTSSRCRPSAGYARPRSTPAHAGDPPRARRQPGLPAHADAGDVDAAFAAARHGGRGALRQSARHTGVTLEPRIDHRRLQPGRRDADGASRHPGAAHDPGLCSPPSCDCRRARCASSARDVGGSFGIKVHVYPDEIAVAAIVDDARPSGQVRRRPARELRLRHPRPRPRHRPAASASTRTADPRVRHRRPDRHRPLFGLSAHQRRSRATRSST